MMTQTEEGRSPLPWTGIEQKATKLTFGQCGALGMQNNEISPVDNNQLARLRYPTGIMTEEEEERITTTRILVKRSP